MARNDTRNVTTARGVAGGYLFSAPRTDAVLAAIHTLCTHLRDLPSGFVNLGYIASDGLSESESATVETETDVDGRPTGAARHDRTETVRVRLVEAARHPLSEQHGRENVTVEDGLLTIHHNNLPREHRVYVAELLLKDGRRWRKVIPDGQVTDIGELALNSRELTGREVTISCNAHTWSTWRGTFTDTVVDVIQLQAGAGEGGDPSDDVTPTGTGRATITTLATSAELVPAWRYGTADYTIETRDPTLTLTATFEDNASSATLTCNGSTQALRNGKPLTVGLGEGRNTISIVSRNERTDVTSVATYRIVATYVPE